MALGVLVFGALSAVRALPRATLLLRKDDAWELVPVELGHETETAFCEGTGADQDCLSRVRDAVDDVLLHLYFDVVADLERHLAAAGIDPDLIEGHTATWIRKVELLRSIVRSAPANATICEIGFNAGHSALNALATRTDVRVVAFDAAAQVSPRVNGDGSVAYVPLGAQFLADRFPSRLLLVAGDSKQTLPATIAMLPELSCNVLFVDGAHAFEAVRSDLRNFKRLASPAWNRVIVDDLGDGASWQREIAAAWSDALEAGVVSRELDRVAADHASCVVSPVERCDRARCDCDFSDESQRSTCCAAICDLDLLPDDPRWNELVSWSPDLDDDGAPLRFRRCASQPRSLHPDMPTTCEVVVGEYAAN